MPMPGSSSRSPGGPRDPGRCYGRNATVRGRTSNVGGILPGGEALAVRDSESVLAAMSVVAAAQCGIRGARRDCCDAAARPGVSRAQLFACLCSWMVEARGASGLSMLLRTKSLS